MTRFNTFNRTIGFRRFSRSTSSEPAGPISVLAHDRNLSAAATTSHSHTLTAAAGTIIGVISIHNGSAAPAISLLKVDGVDATIVLDQSGTSGWGDHRQVVFVLEGNSATSVTVTYTTAANSDRNVCAIWSFSSRATAAGTTTAFASSLTTGSYSITANIDTFEDGILLGVGLAINALGTVSLTAGVTARGTQLDASVDSFLFGDAEVGADDTGTAVTSAHTAGRGATLAISVEPT